MKDALAIRQCARNCIAVLNHYKLPTLDVAMMQSDRTIFHETPDFLFNLHLLVNDEKFEKWPFNRNHGTTAMDGWRERVAMYSMQIVRHDTRLLECDFDLFNPNHGIAPALGHLFECTKYYLLKRKTDPFMIMRGLRKRGIEV